MRNKTFTVTLPDEEATLNLGKQLSRQIDRGMVFLQGPLGIGKTTLVRGFLRGLGYGGLVKSPTYTLIEPYEIAQKSIVHIDLYRIEDAVELTYIGLDETIAQNDIALVEWPERGRNFLSEADWLVVMVANSGVREAKVQFFSC